MYYDHSERYEEESEERCCGKCCQQPTEPAHSKLRKMFAEWVNDDLRHEYRHLLFYLRSGVLIQGLARQELSEYLLQEASSELKHCEEFSRKVVWLGGTPLASPENFPINLTCAREILGYALKMEQEVVDRYTVRLNDLERHADFSDAKALQLFYENQLLDSHETVMNLKELLKTV